MFISFQIYYDFFYKTNFIEHILFSPPNVIEHLISTFIFNWTHLIISPIFHWTLNFYLNISLDLLLKATYVFIFTYQVRK